MSRRPISGPISDPTCHPISRAFFMSAASVTLLLAACAQVPPGQGLAQVQALTEGKTAGVALQLQRALDAAKDDTVARLLAQPLDADAAVQIALLNNPALQGLLASLDVSDAELAQGSRWANPHLALGRFTEGSVVEIERMLRFDVMGLLTLPWRRELAQGQAEQARYRAAQDVVLLAARTRQAWVNAVAAQQSAGYMRDVKDAAEASAELARRMARVGNWSRLDQARQQAFLTDATTQLARAEHTAFAAREQLTRLLGLWGPQTDFRLVERLPDLPATPREVGQVEAQALRQRLDVRAAQAQTGALASSLGLTRATGLVNALDLSVTRSSVRDQATGLSEPRRGLELEVPLPVFDWGQSREARAQALYLQSAARVREVALNARSEARQAWHNWRTSYDLALYHRDEIVPLRQFIQGELQLRYNGMLASVFELLADARTNVVAVNASINALRDFWLADAELQTVLTGTSPGALSGPSAATAAPTPSQGH